MKLIISLFFLLISVKSMKIQIHEMNVFKKSLLNLNNLDMEELDDFSEADNNDNSKIYQRESRRFANSNTTSIVETNPEKIHNAINFTKLHEAVLDETETTNPPYTSSIFTKNKTSNHLINIYENDELSISHQEKTVANKTNKTEIHLTQQIKTDYYKPIKIDDHQNTVINITHKNDLTVIKAIEHLNTLKELKTITESSEVPIMGKNTFNADTFINKAFVNQPFTEHENLHEIKLSQPLAQGSKNKNATNIAKTSSNVISVKLPETDNKQPQIESDMEFENEDSKNSSKWEALIKHDEHELNNNLIIHSKNTVEKYENKETQEAKKEIKEINEIKENKHEFGETKEIKQNKENNDHVYNISKLVKEKKNHTEAEEAISHSYLNANTNNVSPIKNQIQHQNHTQNQIHIQNQHQQQNQTQTFTIAVGTQQNTMTHNPSITSSTASNHQNLINNSNPEWKTTLNNHEKIQQETKPTSIEKKDAEKECKEFKQTIKNETESTKHLFENKLSDLKESIKNSFNQLLTQNQENLLESKKQNFDMLNNLDTLIKSLVKNYTNSHQDQINQLHSETLHQTKELKEAVKSNKIQEATIHSIINNNNVNNSLTLQKNEQKIKRNKLKQTGISIKTEANNSNKTSSLIHVDKNNSNNNNTFVNETKKPENKIIIVNQKQENSNLRNKKEKTLVLKPVLAKEKEQNEEEENFTNKFLADVISKLISHPLHIIDSDEEQRHVNKAHANVKKPNVMLISNSSGTKVENKNVNNYNSHNTMIYNK